MASKPPKTRRRWLRRLAVLAGILAVLLIALYFVITGQAFVKGFVLPRVGQALNADISVARVEVSPFVHLTLRKATFTPKGAETMVAADSVNVRYSLISILRGNILVYKLTSTAPTVTIIWHADGTSNLDPLVQHSGPQSNSSAESAGPFLDVHALSLKNATYRQITQLKGGGSNVLEFTNVTLTAGGNMDFSGTNSIAGNVWISAESLDLTSLYDFLASPAASGSNQPASTAGPQTEPDAVQLPFHHFACDLKIARLRMHELSLADVRINALLDRSDIAVNPCALSLDSAPFNLLGDIDLGVPGYRYNIDLAAERLPLAPFMDTFAPDSKGQVGGDVSADIKLKGTGFTGANLQKNLTGNFDVLATKLDLSIANVRSPILNTIVDVVISIPDIIRNPTALVGGWVRDLVGSKKKSGWVDELTAAPIEVIQVHGLAGKGDISLQQIEISSAAFRAQASGDLAIESAIDHSTLHLPVSLAISRALAKRADILPLRASTNAVYIPLPEFLTVKGTLAKPEAAINKLRVAELAAKTGVGVAESLGAAVPEKADSIIKSADKLITGKSSAPAVTVTNLPPPAPANTKTNLE